MDDFKEKLTLVDKLNADIEKSIKDNGYKQHFMREVYDEYFTLNISKIQIGVI